MSCKIVLDRLGVFGFLSGTELQEPGEDASTGNYGILDQRAAMKWTHDNIRAFGGDPSRVLIVGQSAGADSVAQHLVRPASWPYFSAAGMESGAFYNSFTLTTGVETTEALRPSFTRVFEKTKCPAPDAGGVECLRQKSTMDVFAAGAIREDGLWAPSIDGVELSAPGPVLAANGTLAPVPVFAGYVDFSCCFLQVRMFKTSFEKDRCLA